MADGPDPALPTPSPQQAASRTAAGIVLIVLGGLFFLDRLGYDWGWAWHPTFERMWPVLLIVVGLLKICSPGRSTNVTITDASGTQTRIRRGGAQRSEWILVVGVLMLLHQNHWLTLEQSWPLFIVYAGLSLLFGRGWGRLRGN